MVISKRRRLTQILRHPVIAWLICSHLIFLGILLLRASGALQSIELFTFDQHLRIQHQDKPAEPRIAVVGVTEEDLHQYGWPLTDKLLLELLAQLTTFEPATIGVDLYRDIPVPPGSAELGRFLNQQQHVIWITLFQKGNSARGVPPPAVLAGSDQVGFNDIIPDPGGIVRRALLFLDNGDEFGLSLPLQLALRYLKPLNVVPEPGRDNPEHFKLGAITIPPFESNDGGYIDADAGGYQLLLDYRYRTPAEHFTLDDALSGQIAPESLRGKIVIVGSLAESSSDAFHTPLSWASESGMRSVHGVNLHTLATDQLLRMALNESPRIQTLSDWWESVWIWGWSLLGGGVGLWARGLVSFALMMVGTGLFLLLFGQLAIQSSWWIPSIPAIVGGITSGTLIMAYRAGLEKSERNLLMQLFSRHVSSDVARDIWQRRGEFLDSGRLQPHRLTATVLFTDLRGFTGVSEKMEPQVLLDWLNNYMESMVEQQMRFGGVIDKYIGDAIMAVFGVPFSGTLEKDIEQNARSAVECALAMGEALKHLNVEWRKRNLPTIGMRVGVSTGPLVAGSLGSAQRMDYTVVGDTVNTAARLESFDKNLGADMSCRILISETTRSLLHGRFLTQPVGEVSLKGKDERISIHLVTGYV